MYGAGGLERLGRQLAPRALQVYLPRLALWGIEVTSNTRQRMGRLTDRKVRGFMETMSDQCHATS